MKENYAYIGCVLDRSGSMSGDKINEARSGFNAFLDEQKKLDGKADIQITIFDNKIETIYEGDISIAPYLAEENFSARGMTAYLDALGQTINGIGNTISSMKEEDRPSKVIVLVITDGLENSSHEYSPERIKEMIETQRKVYNWEFVFMGADENSIKEAGDMGIANTILYADTSEGTRGVYETMSAMTTSYRFTGKVDSSDSSWFYDDDKD